MNFIAGYCRPPIFYWLKSIFLIFFAAWALIHNPWPIDSSELPSDYNTDQSQEKKVLVLYSYGYPLPMYQKLNQAFLLEMKKGGVGPDDLFFEFLDLLHNQEGRQRQILADMLRSKYATAGIDLVVILHSPAMNFYEAADLFPKIPVLYWNLQETSHAEDPTRTILHIAVSPDVKGTLERALELFPETERVIIITGVSEIDRQTETEARRALATLEKKLQFEYTSDFSVEEILSRVADLPPKSVIIYCHIFMDKTGRTFTPVDVGEMVAKSANAPVFCLYDIHMERGMIGGSLVSFEAEGSRIGRIALDILSGKMRAVGETRHLFGRPANIFDWQLIKKWGGKANNLPEGTTFLYPPFSLWSYKWHIVGILAVMLVQMVLIGSLLTERRHRRRAEEELKAGNLTLEQRFADRVMQLQKEEARYYALFNSMSEGFALHEIICDPDGKPVDYRFLEINPAFEKLTGLRREAVIGKTARQIIPEIEAYWIEIFGRVALEGTPVHFENHSAPLNRWFEVTAYQNNPGYFAVFFSDITERKQAEKALRESENRLNLAQEIAHLGSWEYDILRKESIWSDEAYRIFGIEPQAFAVTYETFLELVHPDDRAAVNEAYLSSIEAGHDSFEIEHRIIRRSDRAIRFVHEKCQHVRNEDGRIVRSQGMVLDMTERKNSQEKLRQLAYFPEENPNPVLRCTPDGRIMYTNVPAERWLPTFGRNADEAALLPATIREVVATACRHDHAIETEIVNPAGQTFGIHAIQPPGETYVNLYVVELTIRKRALTALERSNQELEQQLRKIGELNESLQATNRLLEEKQLEAEAAQQQLLHSEKLAAIGKLSASIAHEFNNPLQSIMTVLKGIGQYADLKENEVKLVDLARQECRRMGNLIANMQDFYRPTSGKIESANLHAVLDALLLMAKKNLNTRKIAVVKEYAADLPAIDAVTDQLKQVFLNLLNNAADACEEGGVITIMTETLDKEKIAVHIGDSGVGIDPTNINHIFEPFFTTKRQHKGTGLGLSVSYGIIKKHGGEIEVKSELGKGTVFSVILPIQGMRNSASAAP